MAEWLQRLNQIVDRLFHFELRPEELQELTGTRKAAESAKAPALTEHSATRADTLRDELARDAVRVR
jgi:hypothetical protein